MGRRRSTSQDDYKKFEEQLRFKLKFLSYAPLLFISAKTGRNVEKIFPKIDAIVEGYRRKFRTSELNTDPREGHHRASRRRPSAANRAASTTSRSSNRSPPTFALFSNVDEPLHFSYRALPGEPVPRRVRPGRDARSISCIRARKGMKK